MCFQCIVFFGVDYSIKNCETCFGNQNVLFTFEPHIVCLKALQMACKQWEDTHPDNMGRNLQAIEMSKTTPLVLASTSTCGNSNNAFVLMSA